MFPVPATSSSGFVWTCGFYSELSPCLRVRQNISISQACVFPSEHKVTHCEVVLSFNTNLLIMLQLISDMDGIASQSKAIVPHKLQLKLHLCTFHGCISRMTDFKACG